MLLCKLFLRCINPSALHGFNLAKRCAFGVSPKSRLRRASSPFRGAFGALRRRGCGAQQGVLPPFSFAEMTARRRGNGRDFVEMLENWGRNSNLLALARKIM